MALIDAALAFALTLAALATVVTILMEIALRFLGLRKKDQVEVIKRLYDKVLSKDTGWTAGDVEKRWEVVRQVLENPFAAKPMKRQESEQKYSGTAGSGIYADVSLEHVLRRFIEFDEVRKTFETTEAAVKRKLAELSQKYDEYSSAIGTQFRDNARWWSLVFGVVLALVMNVDGVRLFQTYLDNPEKTAAVIKDADEILDSVNEAQKKLDEAIAKGAGGQTIEDFDAAMTRAKDQLETIEGLDLPIGQAFYPHCWLFGTPDQRKASLDPQCEDAASQLLVGPGDSICGRLVGFFKWLWANFYGLAFLTWLLKVLVTGLLIGLGAPFWYDVAKRLAEVRQAFGGKGSAVQRHSGSDGATAKEEDRSQLIDRVARDILAKSKA